MDMQHCFKNQEQLAVKSSFLKYSKSNPNPTAQLFRSSTSEFIFTNESVLFSVKTHGLKYKALVYEFSNSTF